MAVDESISGVNSSFGLPIAGRGPKAIIKRFTAKLVWPFLRHQVDVNHVLVAEMRDLQAKQEILLAVVEQQLSSTGHTTVSIRQLGDQLDFVEDGLHNVENALHILESQYTFVVEQRENHLTDVQAHLTVRTQQLENQIDLGHRQLLARFYDGFGALQRDVTEMARHTSQASIEIHGQLETERRQIATLLARMAEVDHFLTEVKRSYPELVKPEQLVTLATGFDAISRAHALRFRGTPDEVRERVSVYVPELKAVTALGQVLDVGCGSGELLEVLAQNDIDAYGIDFSQSNVDECRALGLDVRCDDVLHHLSEVPAATLGAVTAIHVVEHLDIDTLIEFVDLSLRALRPGGLLIFETPNPRNVTVGADTFYLDPTHLRPIPSPLLEFIVSIRGFAETRVVPFKRAPDQLAPVVPRTGDWATDVNNLAQHLSGLLLGAEDYAVIAQRAL